MILVIFGYHCALWVPSVLSFFSINYNKKWCCMNLELQKMLWFLCSDLFCPGLTCWILETDNVHKCLPHLQACHVGLGAGSHGGSLLQDKALGAGRQCGPCSPLLGSMSSGCLLTGEDQDPPGGERSAQPPLDYTRRRTVHTLDLLHCSYINDPTLPMSDQ